MSDLLLILVIDYGAMLLFLVTFLSCLAIPMPSSLMMLAGGGFIASGDLNLITAGGAVWVTVYVGLGYTFADRIVELADILGNASGFLAAGVVTIGLGFWLRGALKQANING